MLIDQREDRSGELARVLEEVGCQVVARVGTARDLEREVARVEPDVIIVDLDSPDRDTLEGMQRLGESHPRPVVMFAEDSDSDAIRAAVRSGVAAYVVKGATAERVRPVLDVAIARFEAFQALKDELRRTRSSLEERKLVERAKGLLMEKRHMSEQEAYAALRRTAMSQNLRLADLARRVIEMEELL